MGHVFISYAREDRARANAIASALEGAGVDVWLDERLRAGSEFDSEIERALAQASRVIVLWSPASTGSRWVRAEAGDGLDRGILVPVLVEETKVPLEFRRIQTLDLIEWNGARDDPEFSDLLDALRRSERKKDQGHFGQRSKARPPEGTKSISAEPASVNWWLARFRIYLRIGDESLHLQYANWIWAEIVKLNGRTVSKIRFGPNRNLHRFEIPVTANGTLSAELRVTEDGSFFLREFVLRVDGKEVLRRRVRWWDGWALGLALTVTLIFITELIVSSLLD